MEREQITVERVLIIVAHPDDIEFGIGGSVAKWTDAGVQVSYCIVTDGSSGSNDPNTNIEELVELRREEQLAAADVLGVHDVHFLGYRDGILEPTMGLRRDLTRLIRRLKPERVVTFDPSLLFAGNPGFDYINHPDHRATGEAAVYAAFPSAESRPIFPELLDEGYEPHHVSELWMVLTDQVNLRIDITDTIERKLQALSCHASQLDERVVEMVRGWSKASGDEAGVPFAETFRVMRFPRPVENEPPTDGASQT